MRQPAFPVRVDTETLADGVWLLGGTSHNSVAVEFDEYAAVVEAPLDEARNLAVIEEIVRLVPNKPIRFVVNTHQHHDHIGGLRTYMHIGATIITHWKNHDFYTRDVLNYAPRTLDPDMLSLWPPTELAEGYQYERGPAGPTARGDRAVGHPCRSPASSSVVPPPTTSSIGNNAPRRQYVITLSGESEVELGDGTKIRLHPGHILLAEDVDGQGHISRALGSGDRISIFLPLAEP